MSKPASTSPSVENTQLKDIVAHAKEYGFVFQSSEIYDGLAAVYDYGPNGVELKNNLKRLWWEAMTQLHGNVVGIDAAIFMAPQTWEASGHVAGFNDPLIDNLDLSRRRAISVADMLVARGVQPGRLVVDGFGESRPIATNATPQGKAQNRRVEILIRPFRG